jgi:superfamily II DNA helicase RecQ
VEYGGVEGGKSSSGGSQRVDYREVLNADEFAFFDKLRALRKEIAEKQGIPVYAVFTNDQIVAMIKNPPKATNDLLSIAGVGEARVKQYGEAFLNFFAAEKPAQSEENEASGLDRKEGF